MQQRRLRLGDILDDYCPRERRITNHAVVAKIEDDVKRTRCMTCDTEHEYRQGKAPTLRKKKDSVSAAYREVLADVTKGSPAAPPDEPAEPAPAPAPPMDAPDAPPTLPLEPAPAVAAQAAPEPSAPAPETRPELDELPEAADGGEPAEGADAGDEPEAARVHRRLIRATLPRPENQPVARPIPQFTMRQPTGRAGKFRPSGSRPHRPAAGARPVAASAGRGFPQRGPSTHAGRPGHAEGPRARGPQHQRHGKKHSK